MKKIIELKMAAKMISFMLFAVFLVLCWFRDAASETMTSLYQDKRALGVGDIITVIITENASAYNKSETEFEKSASFKTSGKGSGVLDMLPLFGADLTAENKHQGDGKTARAGSISATISAKVVEVLPNNYLLIEGTRTIEINQEKEMIMLSGIIRPRDVKADNTILSSLISDAKISYVGKGVADRGSRQGLFGRLISWIF